MTRRLVRRGLWLLGIGCLLLPLFDDPPLQTGAYLQDVTQDSAVVAMVTAAPAERSLAVRDADGNEVSVAGSFTDWEPVPMARSEGVWEVAMTLEPGVHEYVYIVDGTQVVPPEAPSRRDDGFGGWNGVVVVGAPAL